MSRVTSRSGDDTYMLGFSNFEVKRYTRGKAKTTGKAGKQWGG